MVLLIKSVFLLISVFLFNWSRILELIIYTKTMLHRIADEIRFFLLVLTRVFVKWTKKSGIAYKTVDWILVMHSWTRAEFEHVKACRNIEKDEAKYSSKSSSYIITTNRLILALSSKFWPNACFRNCIRIGFTLD